MIKVDNISVMNMDNAIRGARNPLNSWAKSDSFTNSDGVFILGSADTILGSRLARSGSDHRKFLRQIFVSMDITAPLYWWKEFDTYKVGTVSDSTSTMHKIHAKPFCRDDFSHDHLSDEAVGILDGYIAYLETTRQKYVTDKNKDDWYNLIQLLPSSYNQLRTVTFNYENCINMYYARRNHKLAEWHDFCGVIAKLPYANDLILIREEDNA